MPLRTIKRKDTLRHIAQHIDQWFEESFEAAKKLFNGDGMLPAVVLCWQRFSFLLNSVLQNPFAS